MRKRIMIFCQNCGGEFQIRPYRLGIAKYCSRSCHHQTMSETLKAIWADPNSGLRNKLLSPELRKQIGLKVSKISKASWADPNSGLRNRRDGWITRKANGEVCKLRGISYEELFGIEEAERLREVRRESGKRQWARMSEEERERASEQSRINGAKSIGIPNNRQPSIPEILFTDRLNKESPNIWKYVGDGQVWIAGANPDFLNINGQKLLIETYTPYFKERDYGSVENYIEQRGTHFLKYGFKTLFLDLYEENWDLLIEQVEDFVGGKKN